MRKITALFLFVSLCSITKSQSPQLLSQDPRALQLIQQILFVSGPVIGPSTGTITQGTIQIAGDANTYPIRIYALGNNQSRTEIDRSNGTSVRILNSGKASFQSPGGKILYLNPLNTLSERIMHVPSASLMAE